jgi:hypothetical protein
MRRWLCWLVLAGSILAQTGCFIQRHSSNPVTRMNELLVDSENLRQIEYEWQRFWLLDHPSTLTWDRVSGVVGP